jgi:predicted transposase/invertase (TIGR01784 family)
MRNIENEIYRIKPVEELRFTDDFMFCRVMQNPDLCKGVIERLLGIKVERIEYPELQKEIRPYYSAHGVRMDVYVKDSDRIFDIEMQTSVPDDLPRRMRYYQSMIDIDTLIKGSEYETLKESYVIFLCTKDPFGLGLPVYSFSTVCKEKKDFALNDGINKLFFNASAAALEKNLEIKGFLGYLYSGKPSDTFTEDIEQRVERLKINEIFRSNYMMDALPLFDARQAGLKEGMEQGLLKGERNAKFETARKMLKNKIPLDLVAECTGLSIEEVTKIKNSLKK